VNLSRVSVRVGSKEVSIDLAPVTILYGGRGKSLVLRFTRLFHSLVGSALTPRKILVGESTEASISFNSAKLNSVVVAIGATRSSVYHRYISKSLEVLIESQRVGDRVVHRLKKPVAVELSRGNVFASAESLNPATVAPTLLSDIVDEVEKARVFLNAVGEELRSRKILYLGPYLDPPSVGKTSIVARSYVGRHGEYLPNVMASIVSKPRGVKALNRIIKLMGSIGVKDLAVGVVKPNRVGVTVVDSLGAKSLSKCPCTVKALLTLLVQLYVAEPGSIILVENLDYCQNEGTLQVFSKAITDNVGRGIQIIAEFHNEALLEQLKTPYSIAYSVDLV